MALGYALSGSSSNDADFLHDNVPEGVICPGCGSCLNYDYAPASIAVKPSKKYDVSYTNDLRLVFSQRFYVFCRDVLKAEDVFKAVQSPGDILYYMCPTKVLEFDAARRRTRFEGACHQCGGHMAVVGAHPIFLKIGKPVGAGFYRTDLAFGSGKAKSPLIIVSAEWKRALSDQKFRGIDFKEVKE